MSTTKQRWIDVQHPDEVKRFKEIANDPNEVPWIVEFAKQTLESDVYEDPNPHIRASPLFELSSIKICRDLFLELDGNHKETEAVCLIEVYGHIRLVDDKGNMFTLFKLDYENAKTVILKDKHSVLLRRPQLGTPRYLPKYLKLHILLKDRIRDVVFFDDWKSMSFTHNISYDIEDFRSFGYPVEHSRFSRLESTLDMGFTVFQCAVLATVAVTVLSVGSEMRNDAKVSGIFRASMKLRTVEFSHELFDEPLKLDVGVRTVLCVLAVPAYSPLEIFSGLKFDEEDTFIVNEYRLEFKPEENKVVDKEILNEKWRMLVSVTWKRAFDMLPECFLRELDDVSSSSEVEDSDSECGDGVKSGSVKFPRKRSLRSSLGKRNGHSRFEKQKRPELQEHMKEETSDKRGYYIQPELQTLCSWNWYMSRFANELVEVFCVYVSSFDDDSASNSSGICGKINSYGFAHQLFDYYSRNEMKTGILYPHVTDECLMGPSFCMNLELEDAKGHQISRGFLEYDESRGLAWYNRRVCSVVPGKRGYAAVYYTIFEDAMQANVTVTLMPGNGVEVCLSGSIHARYSNHRYSTHYQKEYYQSTLFEKGKSELVKGGEEVPLTKSMVCVPLKASLIVKIDFGVLIDGKYVETLRGKATFKPRVEDEVRKELKVISGSKSSSTYHLLVSVVWGHAEFVPNKGNGVSSSMSS